MMRNEVNEEKDNRNEEKYNVFNEQNDCHKETEWDSINEEVIHKKSLRGVYERDSIERFGDDLTEPIMQYLWFRHKVLFESLSKQWQSLVFNK